MTETVRRGLRWTPRILGVAFALFLGVFALDVFDGRHGLAATLLALAMHLVPTLLVLSALAIAWKWPWAGAALCAGLVALHLSSAWARFPIGVYLLIDGPLVLMAMLFAFDGWVQGRRRASA